MNILKLTSKNKAEIITQAIKILKAGGLIIYPTETCYGAGVDATNSQAVSKLLNYKTFRQGKPLSIAVADQKMAAKYVHLNQTAKNLYQKFLPGPLTIISKSKHKTAPSIESNTNTIGIRIPHYPLIINLLKQFKKPITATSANVSYKKQPYSIKDILNNTSQKQQKLINLIIDAGTLPKRPPSTIVDTTLDDPLILRQGDTPVIDTPMIDTPGCNLIAPRGVIQHLTKSPQQTIDLAQTLMLKYWNSLQKQPLIFLLIGNLGTGKTQFAKGIGKFLQIKQNINSPTYTISKEYNYNRHKIKGKFIHLDTWRLQNIQEFHQLDLVKELKPKNIIAVEWADRTAKPLLDLAKKSKSKLITIKLQTTKPTHRKITIRS